MIWFPVTAGATLSSALVVSWFVGWGAGVDGVSLLAWLAANDLPGYAVWLAWLLVAPAVLLVAALIARRTPWPWVVACTLHLVGLVALAARARHLVAPVVWPALAVVAALGLTSMVVALQRSERARA